jgi:hypothetical protein
MDSYLHGSVNKGAEYQVGFRTPWCVNEQRHLAIFRYERHVHRMRNKYCVSSFQDPANDDISFATRSFLGRLTLSMPPVSSYEHMCDP